MVETKRMKNAFRLLQRANDTAQCRTRAVSPSITDFGDCLTPGPWTCGFAVSYGNGTLCFNPKWRDFVQTKPKSEARAG